jgi:hypothetical protein
MAADGWGASWSFGPSTSRIIHSKTTMVPGRLAPITSTTGPLFLWPGMSNPTSDLIQTTMDSWPDNASYCGATAGQWCVEASVFGSFGQRNGPTVAIDPDDHVTIEYVLGTDGQTWTQTVTSQKLGRVVSTLQSASGPLPGTGFGFATEADADSFTIDTQYYLCTELHFAAADPHFGSTGVGGIGAKDGATGKGSGIGTAKNLRTPDGGLTWLVDLITLPAMNPQGAQTPPPVVDCGTDGGSPTSSSSSSGATGSSGSTSSGSGGSTSSSSSGGTSSGGAGSSGASSSGTSSSSSGSSGSTTSSSGGSSGASSSGTGSSGTSSGSTSSGASSGSSGSPGSVADAGSNGATGDSKPGCACSTIGRSSNVSGAYLLLPLGGIVVGLIRRRRPKARPQARSTR